MGVELMCLILQSKRQSRYGALKLLDFCMTSYGQPCEEFVDRGGLKNLFGVFMGKARIKGPQGEHVQATLSLQAAARDCRA